MAILRLSSGEIFSDFEGINKILAPVEVGSFPLSEQAKKTVVEKSRTLNRESADFLLETLGDGELERMKAGGLNVKCNRVATYSPAQSEGGPCSFSMIYGDKKEAVSFSAEGDVLAGYLVPHRFLAYDWHYCFEGSFIKGLQVNNDLQACLYNTAGEWMRLDPTVMNWPVFPESYVVGVSFFDRLPNENGGYDMEHAPQHPILETMKF